MNPRIYMDDNASAPLRESARVAAIGVMSYRNASAVHAEGRAARAIIDRVRDRISAFAGVRAEDVVFTASASEANVLALSPDLRIGKRGVTHLLVSAIEHPSVFAGGRFGRARTKAIPVLRSGLVDLEALDDQLTRLDSESVPLVAVMAANNETGVIQPITRIAEIVHKHGGILHCDAVQAAGRLDFGQSTKGADMISLSAHKLGGLTGAGALIVKTGDIGLSPLVTGGGQEGSRRAGTEAVTAIAAFGAAIDEAQTESVLWASVAACRDAIEAHILNAVSDATVVGRQAPRLPNTIQVIVPRLKAETAVIAFDLAGAALSSGSACSSGKVTASPVLKAMGFSDEDSASALRISLPRTTTQTDAERFCAIWNRVIGILRATSRNNAFDENDISTARGAA